MVGKNSVIVICILIALVAILAVSAYFPFFNAAPATSTTTSVLTTTMAAQGNFSVMEPPILYGFRPWNEINASLGTLPPGVAKGYIYIYNGTFDEHLTITMLVYPDPAAAFSMYGSIPSTISDIEGIPFFNLPTNYSGGMVTSNLSMVGHNFGKLFVAVTLNVPVKTANQSQVIPIMIKALNLTVAKFVQLS